MPIFAVVSHKIYNTPGGKSTVIYITAQTQSLTVSEPDGGTLSVTATRVPTGTITYQWQKAESTATTTWTNIAGATTSTYTIAASTTVAASNGDLYRCLLTSSPADQVTTSEILLTVNAVGITISAQPVNTAVSEPDTATFTVTAASSPAGRTLTYQWQKAESTSPNTWANVTTGTGGTTASYTTAASVVSTDSGDKYRCVISRLTSTPATTNEVTFTVNPVVINITAQPTNQTVIETQTATFSVTTTTTPTGRALSYQWQKAESTAPTTWTNIGGATSSSYTTGVLSVSADNGDKYRVVVSRLSSTPVTSSEVTLTVNPIVINITTQPTSQTVSEPDTATFTCNSAANLGTVTYQWQVADVLTPSTWANVTTGTGGTTRTYTTAATTISGNNGDNYRCLLTVPNGSPTYTNTVTITVNPVTVSITTQPTNQSVYSGVAATFTIAAATTPTGRALTYQWQRADVLTPSTWSNISGATSVSYTTTTSTTYDSENGDLFRCIATRALSNNASATSNSATLTITRPTIAIGSQPTNQTAYGTNTATFTASTISTTPAGRTVTYQWQRAEASAPTVWSNVGSSGSVAGGTTSYTTSALTVAADNGAKYRVELSATDAITVTSSEVTLTVNPVVIAISVQPTAQTVYATTTASFSVTAATTPVGKTINYQWQWSLDGLTGWTNVTTGTGGTTASYTTATLTNSDNGEYYRCLLNSTEASQVTSNSVLLTVNPVVISISAHPASVSKYNLETNTFSVTASTTPASRTITYQWQKAEAETPSTWTNIGTNSSSYTTGSLDVTADNGDKYRVVLTTPESNGATSNEATLTVSVATINIGTQPVNTTAFEPDAATFTVATTTTPAGRTVTYQWQKAESTDLLTWTNVGTNSTSYTTPATVISNDDGDKYRVVMNASGANETTSNEVTLTVSPVAINITTQPLATTTGATTSATFSVVASTTPAGRSLTYQWQKAESTATTVWNDISSATGTSYTTGALTVAADNNDLYRVVVSRTLSSTSTTSNSALLTVEPVTITINTHPSSQTVTQGNTATFSVSSSVDYAVTQTYQWQKAESTATGIWNSISGATSSSYTTGALSAGSDNGDLYRVVVSAPGASDVTSNSATLTVPVTFDYLVVAGGGGGGGAPAGTWGAGGGGAGGVRYATSQTLSLDTNYTLTVGTGGTAGTGSNAGGNGGNSILNSITATGGGGGGGSGSTSGLAGGSGGGAFGSSSTGGTGTAGQGNNGGGGATTGGTRGGGGGGGAASVGGTTSTATGGSGGSGATYFGILVGAGGAGGTDTTNSVAVNGTPGTDGTGQGGSGSGGSLGGSGGSGGAGGDGIVVVRYLTTYPTLTISAGLTYTLDTTTYPGYNLYKFTAGTGTINW